MAQNEVGTRVAVIGAGFIGLTTALVFLEQGFHVTVIAEHFPGALHPDYTSPWAGAHWRSFADNDDHDSIENDRITFFKLLELCKTEDPSLLKLCRSFEYWSKKPENFQTPWFKGIIPKFSEVIESKLLKGVEFGIEYEAMCINAPKYIMWLKDMVLKLGGSVLEKKIGHINECFELGQTNIVINCSGIGSKNLGGVEDQAVFPTRGQTILIEAPHIDYTLTKHLNDEIVYIIPRGDGTVVLGGTREVNNSSTEPDPITAQTILKRCQEAAGDLGNFSVLRHSVGFRPTRTGGLRLELEKVEIEGEVHYICHNYGHGGFGFQSSWGSAKKAVEKVQSIKK